MPKVERSTLGVVVATILVAAALKLAQPIMVPLVAGIFLAVVARPIQRSIARSAPRRLRWRRGVRRRSRVERQGSER